MKKIDLGKLVRPSVCGLRAYSAKEIPCKVKLDANESPYAYDSRKIAKLAAAIRTNRYPDPESRELRKAAGKRFGVSSENILQGNGSDELIYYLIAAFSGPVLFPVPTFSMYGIISRALGETDIAVPLDGEFDIDLERTLRVVKKEKPKLIFLSSPNNPTGNCFSSERILKIIETSKGIIVVDEAYQPFSSEKGFLPLLKDYPNLVIMRTLSKIGLAALRVGFLIADPQIIREVNKVRLPFNVNSFSQAIATAALKDRGLDSAIRNIVSERNRLFLAMAKIDGIKPYPSEANFVLFEVKDPVATYNALLKKGVLVRNLADSMKGCLRVTVGTPEENTVFLKALKECAI